MIDVTTLKFIFYRAENLQGLNAYTVECTNKISFIL